MSESKQRTRNPRFQCIVANKQDKQRPESPQYLNIAGLHVYEQVVPDGKTGWNSESQSTQSQYKAEESHLKIISDDLWASTPPPLFRSRKTIRKQYQNPPSCRLTIARAPISHLLRALLLNADPPRTVQALDEKYEQRVKIAREASHGTAGAWSFVCLCYCPQYRLTSEIAMEHQVRDREVAREDEWSWRSVKTQIVTTVLIVLICNFY